MGNGALAIGLKLPRPSLNSTLFPVDACGTAETLLKQSKGAMAKLTQT